jgi:hypothetical protein
MNSAYFISFLLQNDDININIFDVEYDISTFRLV